MGGMRTWWFGVIGVVAIAAPLGGLVYYAPVLKPEVIVALGVLYSAYVTGVVGLMFSVAAKHGVESLATGGGIAGAWKALATAAKPPEPPPPPAGAP